MGLAMRGDEELRLHELPAITWRQEHHGQVPYWNLEFLKLAVVKWDKEIHHIPQQLVGSLHVSFDIPQH
jgi:hypothetical protein